MILPICDRPIENEKEDAFNRQFLAEHVSKIIPEYNSDESISIGICGEWGSGKTSFINLVKNCLQRSKENGEEHQKELTIIEFNPWAYTTQIDLTKEFFSILLKKLPYRHPKEIVKKVLLSVLKCVFKKFQDNDIIDHELHSELSRYYSSLIGIEDGSTLQETKRSISEKLRRKDRRFLIIIDDIDRLKTRDIRMIMQLVKSVADFPNVIYLLGYDDNIVSSSLSSLAIDGRKYLQKIINLQIAIPKIKKSILNDIIYDRFSKKLDKSEYVAKFFEVCIFPFVETLRDVNALFNRFNIKFSVIGNSTYPADLLALTLLELKNLQVLDWIFHNRNMLCGYVDYFGNIPNI